MEDINVQTIRKEVIDKSRALIIERYDYNYLKERFELSEKITEDVIIDIRNYFLNNLYPDYEQRNKLENAFGNLASYMHEPKKVLGLFGNITRAIFKFGLDFKRVFSVGLNSIRAYDVTTQFEQIIKENVESRSLEIPIEMNIYKECLTKIPKSDVANYTVAVLDIFETMVDEKILNKTVGILDNIIVTMRKKSQLYPQKAIDGLSLGRNMLADALAVFGKYDPDTKAEIIALIKKNEQNFLEELYS